MDRRKYVYENQNKETMILRDYLAAERNILANERTYLAYIRTSISFLAAGIGLLKYLNVNLFIHSLGVVFIGGSILMFIISTKNFFKVELPLKSLFN